MTKNPLPTFSKQLPTEVRATDPGQAEEKLTRGWEAFCFPKRGGRCPEDKSTLIASMGAALWMTVWLRQKKGACPVQLRRRGRAIAAGTRGPLSRAQDTCAHRIPSQPRFTGRGPCSAPGCSDQTQHHLSTRLTPACIRKGGPRGGWGRGSQESTELRGVLRPSGAGNTGEPLRTLHSSHPRDPETHSHTPESYVPQKTCVRTLPAALFLNRKKFLEAIHTSTHNRADKETGHLQTMGFQTTLKMTDLWVHTSL